MIQNFISIILFLKILFQAYNFRSTRSSGHQQRFFLFQIFYQKVSKPTKTSEKDHSFFNTASLKKPHVFYEPQLTWHWKEYAPKIQPKTCFTLQIFQQTCFCIVSKKKQHLHCTIFQGLWKQIFVYFCISPKESLYSKDAVRFYVEV